MRSKTLGLFCWALYDWANSAFPTVIQTFVFAQYFGTAVVAEPISAQSQWGKMVSLAALVVAIGGPVLGAAADKGGRRKAWIAVFMLVCVIATAMLWWVKPEPGYAFLALCLVGIATIGTEFANIFYNAMLPTLASPQQMGRWSGWGWSFGYAGGLCCLLVALFGFVDNNAWFGIEPIQARNVRATFVLVSVWYLAFSIPLLLLTPADRGTPIRVGRAVREGVGQLCQSIKQIRAYAHIIRFLIARMIYTDGLVTVFVFGGIYAATTLGMEMEKVLMFGIAMNVTAGLGAAGFAWIDDYIGSKRTILLSLASLALLSTLMVMVGSEQWQKLFGADDQAMQLLGGEWTRSQFWFAIIGLVFGIFVGPAQAASRSYMAKAAPRELRNQMFGLYAFSGKATAFLGPLLVGVITEWSRNPRAGISVVVAFFIIGLGMMLTVPDLTVEEKYRV